MFENTVTSSTAKRPATIKKVNRTFKSYTASSTIKRSISIHKGYSPEKGAYPNIYRIERLENGNK